MKFFIWTTFVLLIAAITHPGQIAADQIPISSPVETIPALIERFATAYQVSSATMTTIISCESSFNPTAVGDHGHSHGLVQIYAPAHPDISIQQAIDPAFAVEYLAQEIATGHIGQWSCARIHGFV